MWTLSTVSQPMWSALVQSRSYLPSWLNGTNSLPPDWRAWDLGSGKWIYHILTNRNFNRSSTALLSVASCRAVSLEFWNHLNSCISFVLLVNRLARLSCLMRKNPFIFDLWKLLLSGKKAFVRNRLILNSFLSLLYLNQKKRTWKKFKDIYLSLFYTSKWGIFL